MWVRISLLSNKLCIRVASQVAKQLTFSEIVCPFQVSTLEIIKSILKSHWKVLLKIGITKKLIKFILNDLLNKHFSRMWPTLSTIFYCFLEYPENIFLQNNSRRLLLSPKENSRWISSISHQQSSIVIEKVSFSICVILSFLYKIIID